MVARRLTAAWVAIVAFASLGLAQIPDLSGEPEAPSVPESLSSPRATMETFLVGMNEGNAALARSTLDLSGLDGIVRNQEGDRLAAALWDVINRTRYVVLERVPEAPSGDAYEFARYDDGRYAIVIARQSDGAWRFSSETVAQIDEVFAYVREQGWDVKRDPTGRRLQSVDLMRANPALWLREQMPASLLQPYLGVELYNYLGILALLVVAFVAGLLIRLLTYIVVKSTLRLEEEVVGKKKRKSIGRSFSLVVNVALIGAGLPYLELPIWFLNPFLWVLKLLGAIGWYWFLSTLWDVFVAVVAHRAGERRRSTQRVVVPVVGKFGRFFIAVGVIVFFIAQLGYNVSALLAGLGIGGLVFALAAKDSVENLFGSITILMEMPFGVGDWVRIGEVDGTVEEINLRSTRIRTFEDSLITMPNSRMITSHVENYGARRRRRLKTTLGITYDTPPAKVEAFCEHIRAMLKEHPKIWNDKRFVFFNDFGASTLNVMLYCFIEAQTWDEELEIRDEILRKILVISEEMGVEFAFPTTTMRITGDSSKLLPG
jgi:MscS family membrane protein